MSAHAYTHIVKQVICVTKGQGLYSFRNYSVYKCTYCHAFSFIFPLQVKNKPHDEVAISMLIIELG